MAAPGRGYTRAVTVAKLTLPLVALGILSTLFLMARNAPQGEPLRFVDETVQSLADNQRLGAPRYNAVTQDGAEIEIVAEELYPDPILPRVSHGRTLAAQMITSDGLVHDLTAAEGTIDNSEMLSTLRGSVVMELSNGYRLLTDAVRMRSDRTYLESLAPVLLTGPPGELSADRMEVMTVPGNERQTRMVFTGGVRLLYQPQGG